MSIERLGIQILNRAEIWFLVHLHPNSQLSCNEYTDRTLSVEDEMANERTDLLLSYAEAKKMKSLTLHTHGCLRAGLRDCFLFFYYYYEHFKTLKVTQKCK